MKLVLRFLSGGIGALMGVVLALVLDLVTGDGIQFIPIARFIVPLAIGGAVGFVLGFFFYKVTGKLFSFLGRFGIDTSA
ncbi:hypothetical protein [Marinobacterium sedimentorum]|uniref:hypothetical protein n=1 Tax=Marinobacterium sedimentorum TaxID=2927804 RepID=UPI0020C60F64|nr:hypothetical protein [Marinobacterium sedimentorum]MCP8690106.1 hypothetical protein [Marinobacterium sedimentorum]